MKYYNAQNVLPGELVKIIQQYVNGEYLYIPRSGGEQKPWGSETDARESLKRRNMEIYEQYKNGVTIFELTQTYYLSDKSIRRIIGEQKKQCSKSLQNHK